MLGGDHSLAAGSVAATADYVRRTKKPLGLIWVDAHGDMNTPSSSSSGNVHGMPLASLLGSEPAELSRIGGFSPKVLPEHTVLIGIRNLDEREKEIVRESRVHVFTMKDIDRSGIAAVVERALVLAGSDTAGVHVSFDLDVCDPSIAPGVGTPVKGGLDYREAHMVMEIIADSGLLRALDLVEVNPILDDRNTTADPGDRAGALGARPEDPLSRLRVASTAARRWYHQTPRAASSVVEHLTFNQGVPGSIPGRPTNFRLRKCNESATPESLNVLYWKSDGVAERVQQNPDRQVRGTSEEE